jgi:hypothetical protein
MWSAAYAEDITLADIARPASEPSSEPPIPVTIENRAEFVADRIKWLTLRSVAPQLNAFRKGFHTCLTDKALNLFNAEQLKAVVEGKPDIDIGLLKAAAQDVSDRKHDGLTVQYFWEVVERYNDEQKARLLKFVTGSERVPITGYGALNFRISVELQHAVSGLPTSSACNRQLMLPDYKDLETLKLKLGIAISECEGFGNS